jgi:DNA-binding winged helix-turn-helix (wHTH) protein/tetratricopeptide (TPR) repeat protein
MSNELPPVLRFGVFEADLRAGELRKNGVRVKIQDLPFRALKLLLSRPNLVITRDEFRHALWPQDVFVDFDRGISSAIKRLRDALGDAAENPIFIETVDRRGYRWLAPTQAPIADASGSSRALRVESESPLTTPVPLAWKWVYVIPVLVALLMVWGLLSNRHLASAGNRQPLSSTAGKAVHPVNREAKDLYLQGRYYWAKRTPDDLNKAVDSFTQAIVHDPGYADAYVGLADCYNLLREYTGMPSQEAYPRALAAARKAVELDDDSSQAHASLAFASFWGTWDSGTADREFRRAIELDPNNATAHHWYANYLSVVNRGPEALAEIERAQVLDPSSKSILADKGVVLIHMGRKDEAMALLRQIESAEPEFVSPHRYLRVLYLETGAYPNFLVELKKEAALTNDKSAQIVAAAAEKGFAAGGSGGMFQAMEREQRKLYDQKRLSAYTLAQTYALEGNKEKALNYLQAAYEQHDENIIEIQGNSLFSGLHDEPAFQQLVAELRSLNSQMIRRSVTMH